MEGFTYNGIHCSAYNVYYVPDAEDKWFKDPEYEVAKKDVAWRNGGYFYGTYAKIRTFQLKCYFEEIDIATREKIRHWLGRNTSGKLVFDDKPFMFYNVRPSDIVPGKIYLDTNESYSGTFTIKFMAEEPFGYLNRKSGITDDHAEEYCGIIATANMPADPTTSSTSFDVYNPGTEACGLNLKLAGSCSNPIRFFNERNNTRCVIESLPTNSLYLDINGDTGNCMVYISDPEIGADNGFAYHDRGFVRLDPCETVYSNSYLCGGKNLLNPTTKSGAIEANKTYVFSAYSKVTTSNTTYIYYEIDNDDNAMVYSSLSVGQRVTTILSGSSDQTVHFSFDDSKFEKAQLEEGSTPTDYMPYISSNTAILNDVVVSDMMIGGEAIIRSGAIDYFYRIVNIDRDNNAIICDGVVRQGSHMTIRDINHIVIQEQNAQGNWVVPTTLSLSHISIDYHPRLL